MSAHTLLNLPTNATIQTGLVTLNVALTTNVIYGTPFPSGSLPLVFIQNSEGNVWPSFNFSVQNLSNTGFTIVQTNLASAGVYEAVGVSWIAIWVPITPTS